MESTLLNLGRLLDAGWTAVAQAPARAALFPLLAAIILVATAIVRRRHGRDRARTALLAAALFLLFAALPLGFGGLLRAGFVAGLAGAALAFVSAGRAPGPLEAEDGKRGSRGRAAWLGLILAGSLALSLYRQTDSPDLVDSCGTGTLPNAARLLSGELSPASLLTVTTGTQGDTVTSLPFVAWHALFQALFLGPASAAPSLLAARWASLVATQLSIVIFFRLVRRFFGTTAALLSAAVFAFHFVTLLNARSETIFSFSVLVLLAAFEAIFTFADRPTALRFLAVAAAVTLAAYVMANIRVMLFAAVPPALLVLAKRPGGRLRGPTALGGAFLLAAAATAALDASSPAPVRGYLPWSDPNAEHLLSHWIDTTPFPEGKEAMNVPPLGEDRVFPGNPTPFRRRLFVLGINVEFLLRAPLGLPAGTTRGVNFRFPILTLAPALAGFAVALKRASERRWLFLVLLAGLSILPVLLAYWANADRVMLLGPAHAALAGVFLAEIAARLRVPGRFRARRFALAGAAGLVLLDVGLAADLVAAKTPRAALRRWILARPPSPPLIAAVGQDESAWTYYAFNPPQTTPAGFGRVPLVALRSLDVGAPVELVEKLRIPAVIVTAKEWPGFDPLAKRSGWRADEIPETEGFFAIRPDPDPASAAWMRRLDAAPLRRNQPSRPGRIGPIMDNFPSGQGRLEWDVDVPVRIEEMGALVRFWREAKEPAFIRLSLDGGAPCEVRIEKLPHDSDDFIAACALGPAAPGRHKIDFEGAELLYLEEVFLLGRTAPESLGPSAGAPSDRSRRPSSSSP